MNYETLQENRTINIAREKQTANETRFRVQNVSFMRWIVVYTWFVEYIRPGGEEAVMTLYSHFKSWVRSHQNWDLTSVDHVPTFTTKLVKLCGAKGFAHALTRKSGER